MERSVIARERATSDEGSEHSDDEKTHTTALIKASKIPLSITPELIFLVDFSDGYSHRQLMDIAKLTVTSYPLFFSALGITMQRGNGAKTAIISCELNQHNFAYYLFNNKLVSNPSSDANEAYHVICPNISKLREAIRPVARKEGVRFYQYKGDACMYVQVYGGTKNGEGCGTIVPLEVYDHIDYELDEYHQTFDKPNCRIPLAEFCGFCAVVSRTRGVHHVEFRTYAKGVWILSIDSSGNIIGDKKWGECDDSHRVPIYVPGGPRIIFHGGSTTSHYTINIAVDTIKALAKMTNLVVNGILRVYAERNELLRLQTSVNYYGPLTFYLRQGTD
jgi:hypothetical protein